MPYLGETLLTAENKVFWQEFKKNEFKHLFLDFIKES